MGVIPPAARLIFFLKKINDTYIIMTPARVCRLASKHERLYFKLCAKIHRIFGVMPPAARLIF